MGQRKENLAMGNIAALFSRIEKLEAEKVELTHIIEDYQEKDRGRVDTIEELVLKTDKLKADHAEAIEKLKKELESAKSTRDYNSSQLKEAQNELDQLHSLLDALPKALPRETPNPNNKYSDIKHSAMTRLASWLALK